MTDRYPVAVLGGVPIVTAPAEIDASHADRLRAAILGLLTSGHATFVLDMRATTFCDSAGLHVIVRAHKRAQAQGGEARLVITKATVLRVFAITGLDRVIPNFATVREAMLPPPAPAVPRPLLESRYPAPQEVI
jgi:anti-sigma B factor antagonist